MIALRQVTVLLCDEYLDETTRPAKQDDPKELGLPKIDHLARTGVTLLKMVKQAWPPLQETPPKSKQDQKREDDALRARLNSTLSSLCEAGQGAGSDGTSDACPAAPAQLASQ